MLKLRTHFEQVPLALVMKVATLEPAPELIEPLPVIRKKKPDAKRSALTASTRGEK
jgi:hypothetical protein